MITDILKAMPLNRECTIDDVCQRFRDKNKIQPNPDIVKDVLRKARTQRLVDIDYYAVNAGNEPFYRRLK